MKAAFTFLAVTHALCRESWLNMLEDGEVILCVYILKRLIIDRKWSMMWKNNMDINDIAILQSIYFLPFLSFCLTADVFLSKKERLLKIFQVLF